MITALYTAQILSHPMDSLDPFDCELRQAGSNLDLWKFPSPFPFWKRSLVILFLFIVLLLYILIIYM